MSDNPTSPRNVDDALPDLPRASGGVQTQTLHFVHSRSRPVKIRRLTDLHWTYFPDIKTASQWSIVRQRIPSRQGAEVAITKLLSKCASAHDLVAEHTTFEELVEHNACDYIKVTRNEHPYTISLHPNWVSMHTDPALSLRDKYSTPSTLNKAALKAIQGREISGLKHIKIELIRNQETPSTETAEYEKPRRIEESPHKIAPPRTPKPQKGKTDQHKGPCKHRCLSKLSCAHKCCKIYGPLPSEDATYCSSEGALPPEIVPEGTANNTNPGDPSKYTPESTSSEPATHTKCNTHASNGHRKPTVHDEPSAPHPCRHSCKNKATCGHLCCKRGIKSSHLDFPISATSTNENLQTKLCNAISREGAHTTLERGLNPATQPPPGVQMVPPAEGTQTEGADVNQNSVTPNLNDNDSDFLRKAAKLAGWAMRNVINLYRLPNTSINGPTNGNQHTVQITDATCTDNKDSTMHNPAPLPDATPSSAAHYPQNTVHMEPCRHRYSAKLRCLHKCCKIYGPLRYNEPLIRPSPLPPPSHTTELRVPSWDETSERERLHLLEQHKTITGGKMCLKLNDDQWKAVENKAYDACRRLQYPIVDTPEIAVKNAELLGASLAVAAYEIAQEINPTKGFLTRSKRGHARFKHRTLSSENAAHEMTKHIRNQKKSLRYTHGTERQELRRCIKESEKLEKTYTEEAKAHRKQLERQWAHSRFTRNPWTAASEALDRPSTSATAEYPECDLPTIEKYFTESTAPPAEEHRLPPNNVLGPLPINEMEWSPLTAQDVADALSSKRSASAPGRDTITNALLKQCKYLYPRIANTFNDLLRYGVCPPCWSSAVVKLIHKRGQKHIPKNWRPISLTSALGKLFNSMIGHQILTHTVSSGLLDTSVQKGFLPKMSGTLEHTQALSEILQYYRRNKRQYCLTQFDLSNAFGSVPHNIIFEALRWANVSPQIVSYVESMYSHAEMRIKCVEGLSRAIPIHRGVLQGDTLSPIIFNLVMETVLRYLKQSCPRYGLDYPDTPRHFLKAHVDDLTILTSSDTDMQHATNTLETALRRIGLSINVDKSRTQCMSMREGSEHPGYMTRKPRLNIEGKAIPHICDRGSTFLGMTIAPGAQQAKELFKNLDVRLRTWLRNVDESAHSLPEKLWI